MILVIKIMYSPFILNLFNPPKTRPITLKPKDVIIKPPVIKPDFNTYWPTNELKSMVTESSTIDYLVQPCNVINVDTTNNPVTITLVNIQLGIMMMIIVKGTNDLIITAPEHSSKTSTPITAKGTYAIVLFKNYIKYNILTNPISVEVTPLKLKKYTAPESNQWTSVTWSPQLGIFVAVACSGTNRVMTSPDGITWTGRKVEENNWVSLVWSPELSLFVAVSSNGDNRVMTSSDGTKWDNSISTSSTSSTSSSSSYKWQSITWSPQLGIFVVVGINSVMTSSNGVDWVSQKVEANYWSSVTWSPERGMFCAVSRNGNNRVMTSSDGVNWTVCKVEPNGWVSVAWSPQLGIFCAVAYNGNNRVMTSPDGVKWVSQKVEANEWRCVTWSPERGMFCAVSQTGTNRVMTIHNIVQLTTHMVPEANLWRSVTWSPERNVFVAVSASGTNRVMVDKF